MPGMVKLFNRILVPVDFSPGSINALERGVEMAKEYQCHLHLLHVISDQTPVIFPDEDVMGRAREMKRNRPVLEFELAKLAEQMRQISDNEVGIGYTIEQGRWNSWVIDLVNNYSFDLVLLSMPEKVTRKIRYCLDVDRIAAATDIPVITIPVARQLKKFYSVLIPVTDFLPIRKLIYGVYIASQYKASVQLLGVEGKRGYDRTHYFLERAYDLIRECPLPGIYSEMSRLHKVEEAVQDKWSDGVTSLVILNPDMQPDGGLLHRDNLLIAGGRHGDFPILKINRV